jgi:hypothetical protein
MEIKSQINFKQTRKATTKIVVFSRVWLWIHPILFNRPLPSLPTPMDAPSDVRQKMEYVEEGETVIRYGYGYVARALYNNEWVLMYYSNDYDYTHLSGGGLALDITSGGKHTWKPDGSYWNDCKRSKRKLLKEADSCIETHRRKLGKLPLFK